MIELSTLPKAANDWLVTGKTNLLNRLSRLLVRSLYESGKRRSAAREFADLRSYSLKVVGVSLDMHNNTEELSEICHMLLISSFKIQVCIQ